MALGCSLKIGVIFFDSIIERIQSVLPVSFHLLCPNGIAAHNETFSTFLRQHLRYRFVKKGHLQNTLFQQALNLRLGQGRNVVEVIFVFFEKLNLRSFDHAAVAHKRHFTTSEALGNLVDLAGKCLGI